MTEASSDPEVFKAQYEQLMRDGQSGLDRKQPLSVKNAPRVIPTTKDAS